MNKKLMSYLTSGLLILGITAGFGVYQTHAAQAAATKDKTAVTAVDNEQRGEQKDEQQPAYQSSVKVADTQDNEKNDKGSDAAESKALQSLAKITSEQAQASALKAVPGQVKHVKLENENGNVVYSVKIKTAKNSTEVKIDAGNGKVLAQEIEQDKDKNNNKDQEEKNDGPENDNNEQED